VLPVLFALARFTAVPLVLAIFASLCFTSLSLFPPLLPLASFGLLVGDQDIGEELTHDTFLKAWQELPRLRDAARFDSWLYRIARNLAWNWLQRQRIVQWLPLSVAGFEHVVEERMLLREALARIAPQYRECVILQVVLGMPQANIAVLM
jgi:RNA polymerase sigma-70 factor (ECF subfamily)